MLVSKRQYPVDLITTRRITVEQSEEWSSPVLVNFIDFEKTLDSMGQGVLWKVMCHYGISEKIVNFVKFSCEGTKVPSFP